MFEPSGELKYEVFVPAYVWRLYKSLPSRSSEYTEEQRRALDEYQTLEKAASNYCSYKWGAIQRIGCYCCYGDGPNLSTTVEEIVDSSGYEELNSAVIKCYIDFDFDADEYR